MIADLSRLGIMNVTRTPLGKFMMKQWFLRPSLDIELIESRYDAVECFLRGENRQSLSLNRVLQLIIP